MRWANGWIAEVNEDDPDKIKDSLMDLCDHKKAELVVRHSIDKIVDHKLLAKSGSARDPISVKC